MSNSFKLKKGKSKKEDVEEKKQKEPTESKYGAKFMKGKREKGTISNGFSGKSSKEFSRKKT